MTPACTEQSLEMINSSEEKVLITSTATGRKHLVSPSTSLGPSKSSDMALLNKMNVGKEQR